ncbi:MAG: hypothetical protein ACJ8C4_08905 [Gemmataceae bacterium]
MESERPRRKRRQPTGRPAWIPIVWASAALCVLVGIGLATLYVIKSRAADSRLIGTWKSDADATIADIRTRRPVTEQQELALRKLFGKMTITYDKKTYTSNLEGTVDTEPITIVSKDSDSVSIKVKWALDNSEKVIRIQFVGSDIYWVEIPGFDMRECFRRVS